MLIPTTESRTFSVTERKGLSTRLVSVVVLMMLSISASEMVLESSLAA